VEESVIVAGDERTGDDDLVDVCDVPRQGQAEPESVAVLRLRLALAREERMTKERESEIEKERMSMQSEGQRSAQNVSGSTDLKDIKAMLPSMQDCDIMSFFTSFERILQLHGLNCCRASCQRKHFELTRVCR